MTYFESRILTKSDPRSLGKPLTGKLSGYWSYRIGDHRVIAEIQDHRFIILAVRIPHRSKVYDWYSSFSLFFYQERGAKPTKAR